jgi:hypothetical protein
LTSTLDRDWGDLPIRPDFVPLLQRLLRYLTRTTDVNTAPVLLGRPAKIEISDRRIGRVQVRTPAGVLRLSERPRAQNTPWTFAATDAPGHYEVAADPPLPGVTSPPGFAVAVDPSGSDLRPVTAQLAPGHSQERPTATAVGITRRTELWHAALALLFIMLLGEALLLFKRRKEDPQLPRRRGTGAAAG